MYKNFGFGIGNNFKEDLLLISATNETRVEAGMIFHIRITIRDQKEGEKKETIIAIGDTIIFENDDNVVILTENIPRKISYTLDDDEEEDDEDKENQNDQNTGRRGARAGSDIALGGTARTRYGAKQQSRVGIDENLKKSQNGLLKSKLEELKKRFANEEIQMGAKK